MSNIQPFTFRPSPDSSLVLRTFVIEGEPWFVAADVCVVLELGNPTMTLRRLDDDEQTLSSIEGRTPTGGATQTAVSLINESGLYSLILGSRKPQAKPFKRWVTGEVLPAIRKTGRYAIPEALPSAKTRFVIETDSKALLRLSTSPRSTLAPIKPFRVIPRDLLILRLDPAGPDLVSRRIIDLDATLGRLVTEVLMKLPITELTRDDLHAHARSVVGVFKELVRLPRLSPSPLAALVPETHLQLADALAQALRLHGFIPLTLTIDDQGPLFSEL